MVAPLRLISSDRRPDRVPELRNFQLSRARPWLWQGTVIGRTKNGFMITSSAFAALIVNLSQRSTIWKEVDTHADSIQVGDFLYVKGDRQADGSIDALAIWANIGWHRGVVTSVDGGSFRVDGAGGRVTHLTPNTVLFNGGAPNSTYTLPISPGQHVEALGMFVAGGHLRATRVWVGPTRH